MTIRDQIRQRLAGILPPDNLDEHLVRYTQDPNLRLILITGSAAIQQLQLYSDIDVVLIWGQPDYPYPPYELRYFDTRLVSITSITYQEWKEKMSRLDEVVFARAATLDAIVIYEVSDGIYNSLWKEAAELELQRFDPERKIRINHTIRGYVEELHKIFNGVNSDDEYLIYYGMLGLQLGIGNILTNYFALMYDSENEVISAGLDSLSAAGRDDMVRLWHTMWGFDESKMIDRGRAAIAFYLQLIDLVDDALDSRTRQFLATTTLLGQSILS